MPQFEPAFRRSVTAAAVAGLVAGVALSAPAARANTVRVALGDVVSVKTLAFLIVMERVMDRGVGISYSVTQQAKIPLKVIC